MIFSKVKDFNCYGYIIPQKVLAVLLYDRNTPHRFFLGNSWLSSEIFGNLRKFFGKCGSGRGLVKI